MARLVIWTPPNTRMTAEKAKATSSAKMENAILRPPGIRSTMTGIFMCPRSLVTRLAPSRAIQANR